MRTEFRTLLIVILLANVATSRQELSAADVPILETEDKTPGSLHRWHLYEHDDARAVLGDKVQVVGCYDAANKSVQLASPPWITVAFAREKQPGQNRVPTLQTFGFQLEEEPTGIDANGFVRLTGSIAVNRPDLSIDQKHERQISVFRLQVAEAEPVPCIRAVEQLQKDAANDVRKLEPQLKEICAKQNLTYDFAADKLSWSWYKEHLAFTTIVTKHPGYSRNPVAYATISALYDPATGKLSHLVFQRRVWQDPRD